MSLRACKERATSQNSSKLTPASRARATQGCLVDFLRRELAFEREEHAPFALVEFDGFHLGHLRGASARSPGSTVLRRTCPTPSTKIPFAGISRKCLRADVPGEQCGVFLE